MADAFLTTRVIRYFRVRSQIVVKFPIINSLFLSAKKFGPALALATSARKRSALAEVGSTWKEVLQVQHRLLIVDDERIFLDETEAVLTGEGYQVDTARSGTDAIQKLLSRPRGYSLVILDYRMNDEDGAMVARSMHSINPDLYILIYSGDKTRDAVISAWKAGVVEFVEKNGKSSELIEKVKNWCRKYEETTCVISVDGYQGDNTKQIEYIGMVGRSAALAEIAREVKLYRETKSNILILGDSGAGKELIAKALHKGHPDLFRAVNCATYSSREPALMEAELFGAEKGSYTGADRNRRGIFEEANGGTVFLDEIHTLSIPAQQKLLRAINEKKIRPVGTTKEIPVNVRIIAAAKPDLDYRVKKGEFLIDLKYRINTLEINVPPLRERPEDVEPLVAFFCQRYCNEYKVRKIFLARTVRYMETYAWPGNVRELEHMVERLCARTEGEKITPEHLEPVFFKNEPAPMALSTRALKNKVEELTRETVSTALKVSRSQREAARRLGIPRSSFHDLVKKFNLGGLTRLGKSGDGNNQN
jgi:DNA-binding NtrC family response regulator